MQQDKQGLEQRVDSLQRDRQRLEGELDEAQRQVKVTKARQAKLGAAREEGKESKVTICVCGGGAGIWGGGALK